MEPEVKAAKTIVLEEKPKIFEAILKLIRLKACCKSFFNLIRKI
jgi:hypothetical protein